MLTGNFRELGINPARSIRDAEHQREAVHVNTRVKLRNTEDWTPRAREEARTVEEELREEIRQATQREEWKNLELQSICLISKMARLGLSELVLHVRWSQNLQCLLQGGRLDLPYPGLGTARERRCLFCLRLLMLIDGEGGRAISCLCVNTSRYGPLELDACEEVAILLFKKFWACETFAEALEFFQARMNAQHLTEGMDPHTTPVVGLAVDRWSLHLKGGHVSKLKSLGYPIEQPPAGETGTTRAPARLAIVAARGVSKVIDLKAPPQTDPFRLASQYHEKERQKKGDPEGTMKTSSRCTVSYSN